MSSSLFPSDASPDAVALAAHLAMPARPGHYDELRDSNRGKALRPHWRAFFEHLGTHDFAELTEREETVARQIRENGITYNIYADADGPTRLWSLDLLPFIIPATEWPGIEQGLAQRATLLNRIVADIYGPQALLSDGLIPPALVYGHPGYLRPLCGFRPPGDTYLHIVAFDLARAPDGKWWVVSQRTQAPSGLGYVLENRLTISNLFNEPFQDLRVQHLASSYRTLVDMLYRLSPLDVSPSSPPRIVLLTPGPYNETYFEQTFLARYLGLTLVEGGDLTVRDNQLFLKTLHGLERVHAVLRRLDDDFCDPLELRSDSALGIPGLLQAMRAGNVLVANSLGTSFLESPAFNGFLPGISQRLLGEDLLLPSLASWWCGEQAALTQIMPYLATLVIKATYPGGRASGAFEPIIGAYAQPEELAELRARIEADPDAYTLQAYLPLSQAPTWSGGHLVPRAAMVRMFAIADGKGGWNILPGGLTRVGSRDQRVVSMQSGGSSVDTWVTTTGEVDTFSMLPEQLSPEDLAQKRRPVSSRAAENMFWMGRYTERTDAGVRLARLTLDMLKGGALEGKEMFAAVSKLCVRNGLVSVPVPWLSARAFEHALLDELTDDRRASGITYNLEALANAAGQIRDRLSPDHWRLILAASEDFVHAPDRDPDAVEERHEYSAVHAQLALQHLGTQLSAITGAQTDRMTRDDGWRLLTIGRQTERLSIMAVTLQALFAENTVLLQAGFALLLDVFDSTITYRAYYQSRHEIPVLLNLLVLDTDNPRSLACIVDVLRGELARFPDSRSLKSDELLAILPDAGLGATLSELCERDADGRYAAVLALAQRMFDVANTLSNEIGRRYFSHAIDFAQTVRS